MGKGCIDLGLPTEAKPEWTISLDYTEQKEEKKEPEKDPFAPGENVDMSDLTAMRAMLAGGK